MAYTRLSNLDLIEMPNCIALTEHGRCTRLSISKCLGKDCSFQCSKEETEISKRRLMERLSVLDDEKQRSIACKYYGGKKLWKEVY